MNPLKIIKSKFASKEDWYHRRLEVCFSCENWSDNKGETKGLAYKIGNFGKAHCLKCGCGESKMRLPEEQCPLEEPKWGPIVSNKESTHHTVENKSPNKAKINKNGHFYVVDYGTLKQNEDSKVEIGLTLKDEKEVKASSSCGCTNPTIEKTGDNEYLLSIFYNTNILGQFKKNVYVKYNDINGIQNQITFPIMGTVIR